MAVMQPSPFPGMDPYLEAYWSDIHLKLLAFAGEALQPKLPPALRARNDESVWIEQDDGHDEVYRRIAKPDVFVVEDRPADAGAAVMEAATLPARRVEPVTLSFRPNPPVHRWVQIVDASDGNRVVTVIEVLSPSNKRAGDLNDLYRRKLEDYADAGVSLVEIDLLRGSRQHLAVRTEIVPRARRAAYYACVRRGWAANEWKVYPMSLREPLPAIPVPLRRGDKAVWLELQPLIDRAYAAGAYDRTDYAKPARPPLRGEDAAWADALLREAGRR